MEFLEWIRELIFDKEVSENLRVTVLFVAKAELITNKQWPSDQLTALTYYV